MVVSTMWFRAGIAQSQPAAGERVLVRQDFFGQQYERGIADYKRLPAGLQNLPDVSFFAGQCYWRRHDFDSAQHLLQVASTGNLREPQHTKAIELYGRANEVKRLCPPYYHDFGAAGLALRVYARKTNWALIGYFHQMRSYVEYGTPTANHRITR